MDTKVSRRDFLKGTAVVTLSSMLVACGATGKSEYEIFETANLGNIKITFETLTALSTINPDKKVYFAPKIAIENTTKDTLTIDMDTDFEAYYDGERYPIYKEGDKSKKLPETITAGEKVSGYVYFEEPQETWREFKMNVKLMHGKYGTVSFVYHNYKKEK